MELDYNVVRLISAEPSKIATYNGRQLKESILKSEGRVLMGQTYLPSPILIPDCTSTELMFAFGTDMVLLNGYDFDISFTRQDNLFHSFDNIIIISGKPEIIEFLSMLIIELIEKLINIWFLFRSMHHYIHTIRCIWIDVLRSL